MHENSHKQRQSDNETTHAFLDVSAITFAGSVSECDLPQHRRDWCIRCFSFPCPPQNEGKKRASHLPNLVVLILLLQTVVAYKVTCLDPNGGAIPVGSIRALIVLNVRHQSTSGALGDYLPAHLEEKTWVLGVNDHKGTLRGLTFVQ